MCGLVTAHRAPGHLLPPCTGAGPGPRPNVAPRVSTRRVERRRRSGGHLVQEAAYVLDAVVLVEHGYVTADRDVVEFRCETVAEVSTETFKRVAAACAFSTTEVKRSRGDVPARHR